MHAEARQWAARWAPECEGPVLEIGSRDINGGVRDLFPEDGYHGLDLIDGRGVDEAVDVLEWKTRRTFSTVVCCEVLEHHPDPEAICRRAYELLRDGGVFIVTAAGPTRQPHSGIDGEPTLRADEHYANIAPDDLAEWLSDFAEVEVDEVKHDVRAVARK